LVSVVTPVFDVLTPKLYAPVVDIVEFDNCSTPPFGVVP
jgi:hypothetical protein